jgi:hypothetical protein
MSNLYNNCPQGQDGKLHTIPIGDSETSFSQNPQHSSISPNGFRVPPAETAVPICAPSLPKPSTSKALPASANKSRFIKLRFSNAEYSYITRMADELGMHRSDYIRERLVAVHKQLDVAHQLEELRAMLGDQSESKRESINRLVMEAVLMLREWLASRDPQAISRVKAQLQQIFVEGGQQ